MVARGECVPFPLRVNRSDPAKEVVSRIAWLNIWREIQHEARTDSGKPGSFDLFRHEKTGSLLLLRLLLRTTLRPRFRPRRIDTVVQVLARIS